MGAKLHVESFLEMMSVERNSAANTLESYRRDMDDFVETIKSTPETCTEEEIATYLQSLKKQGFSTRTRARRLSSLRQFFNYLYIEKIRADNPCAHIDAPKLEKPLPKYLSEREITTMLETAASDLRLSAMLELLYATGMRVTELVSLKRSAFRHEGEDYFLIVKGKGDKERVIPVGRMAVAALKNYLATTKQKTSNQQPATNNQLWLFPSGKSHITRQRFGQILKELALKSNLDPEKVSPHVLRHSFASHMLEHGADLRLVQELLGHEQIATTQIYTHVQSTKLHKLVTAHHPLAKT